MDRGSVKVKKLSTVALFLSVTVLTFWKPLFHRDFTLMVGNDTAESYYPWFDIAARWLKKGVLLLWDPYVYSGKVNMGEPQPGLYYPLNWLFMLLPVRGGGMNVEGMQALMILDYFLAGLFFYLLARSLDLTPRGSVVAGSAWAFGGFTTQLYGYINVLSGFVWLPLAFLFYRRALLGNEWPARVRCAVASGLFLALSFLPGHHIPPIHTGLLLLLYTVFVAVSEWNRSSWTCRAARTIPLAMVALTSVLLTALQWLPSAQWARHVYRWIGDAPPVKWGEAVPYSALQHASNLSPQDVLSLLLPYVSTNASLYTGFPVLFLALVGVLFVRKPDSRFFALAAFLYLFMSWGRYSALHGWVNTFVPTIWFAREVFYYLVLLQACLALLAGWGLDYLCEAYGGEPETDLRVFIRRAGWIIALLVLFAGALVVGFHFLGGIHMDHPYFRATGSLAAYATAFGILLFLLHTRRLRVSSFGFLLAALVVLDLSSHVSDDIRPKISAGNEVRTYVPDFWKPTPPARFLMERRKAEIFRVDDGARIFPNNFGDAWQLDSTMGHGATALVDYFDFRGTGWGPASNASPLLNVRYFTSPVPIQGMNKVFGEGGSVFLNPRAVPRVFAAARCRSFSREEEMLAWIAGPALAPRETVLVNRADAARLPPDFLREAGSEDGDVPVDVISYERASERRTRTQTDEEARNRETVFHAPWGWSTGDEVRLRVRLDSGLDHCYLILNYVPTTEITSRIRVLVDSSAGRAEIPVDLPGLKQDESEPQYPRQAVADLGPLPEGTSGFYLSKTEACSANLDAVRVSRFSPGSGELDRGEVRLTSFEPNRLVVDARLKRASFIVLSEVYYPGWEALIDGRPAPLLRADYILRAVPVPAGKHEIVVRFRPKVLLWGSAVSLLALATVIAVLKRGKRH